MVTASQHLFQKHTVSLRELKKLARSVLPVKSALRSLILDEPDQLPITEVIAKIDIFVKLLYLELRQN